MNATDLMIREHAVKIKEQYCEGELTLDQMCAELAMLRHFMKAEIRSAMKRGLAQHMVLFPPRSSN